MTKKTSKFAASLRAEDLPAETLLSLWKRTSIAHQNLFQIWFDAVSDLMGKPAAEQLSRDAWPQHRRESMYEVFLGDLSVISEVVKSAPAMLTIVEFDEALIPDWLSEVGQGGVPPRLEDLSRPALAQLWNLAALAYMMVTDRWYGAVEARHGADAARKLEKEVWVDRGAAEDDLRIGLEALEVRGSDVEALLRGFQFAPGEVGILDVEFELRNPGHGILTHRSCPALTRFEQSDPARLKHACEICVAGMPLSGEVVSGDISCRPLKLPPRLHSGDIACRWEYRTEPAAEGP